MQLLSKANPEAPTKMGDETARSCLWTGLGKQKCAPAVCIACLACYRTHLSSLLMFVVCLEIVIHPLVFLSRVLHKSS